MMPSPRERHFKPTPQHKVFEGEHYLTRSDIEPYHSQLISLSDKGKLVYLTPSGNEMVNHPEDSTQWRFPLVGDTSICAIVRNGCATRVCLQYVQMDGSILKGFKAWTTLKRLLILNGVNYGGMNGIKRIIHEELGEQSKILVETIMQYFANRSIPESFLVEQG